ncbi:hypothetical protein [Paenibacillus popilliae]|uniref:hypothetical protein n=1 Tax=Paenibacillus popilliae TaxID=78057 RepID=UPI0011D2583A|nr:hypothetical protein [Paenibacillus popilliae]
MSHPSAIQNAPMLTTTWSFTTKVEAATNHSKTKQKRPSKQGSYEYGKRRLMKPPLACQSGRIVLSPN